MNFLPVDSIICHAPLRSLAATVCFIIPFTHLLDSGNANHSLLLTHMGIQHSSVFLSFLSDGTCHTTSMEACPISLGCDPKHSFLEGGCFPLPACKNIRDSFKLAALLIPKHSFHGDPNQAHWTSDFHHIAPYAKIDSRHQKLLLRTRRYYKQKEEKKSGVGIKSDFVFFKTVAELTRKNKTF